MSVPSTDPLIGRLIDGRYQVRSRIARGGMATVYLATDLRLERRVAIKIMHGHLADDSAFKIRFIQEARSAARLAHPNVVNVFDQGQDDDMAYLVMEYLPGITLRDLLKDYGRLTPEQTLDILEAVLSGLAAAHKAGIVHRDVKPENVLLADDGRIKISDFGLARAVNNNTATGQALLGTIAYLSPELVTRGIADARSDIYALGIMTFEMLTGDQPYVGEAPMQIAYQHANDTVPMPSSKVADVPRELDELVLWATARDPEERPRDARVMLDQLHDVSALVRGGTQELAMQSTMVLPANMRTGANALADAETQVLGARLTPTKPPAATLLGIHPVGTGPVGPPDSGDLLSKKAGKRKRRGFWLFALVIILAAIFGGTGWYFGSGPGSDVMLPDFASASPDTASSQLTELGLKPELGGAFSATIAEGLVIGTDPDAGSRVPMDSTVTVIVSQGLQPITLPALAGTTQAEASAAIANLNALVGSIDPIFNGDVPEGSVISASKESDGTDVSAGGDYFEGLTVNLVVSLGPIPNVDGKTVAAATDILAGKNLLVVSGEQTFNDTVAKGDVITAQVPEGAIREGATLTLVISRGPEPVIVPNVVGMSWSDGKDALTNLGFKLTYNPGADLVPAALLKVAATDPVAGTSLPKGSSIALTPQF
ncbi:Stk1 family PASTA domain-containing Ser/Thr kinase [Cryobacterium sp. PH29-G1]|uniref:Stk1 family PASTA domain-containing Ser/Thr kinase n=1 Tax=Cryobacterium sp. PH29-G1 TaxID=3046211 RepID=UPI0024BA0E30|nr:Stk1 family PASTA domain-containing Ser/Thr kinase [Cryobacterium sp. PH29-G1]MDJ0348527.1 Stk1 family PASTA domain-containing Ser/Thr kinase [Cryobacterium sp. PH29-G1]